VRTEFDIYVFIAGVLQYCDFPCIVTYNFHFFYDINF
jgi:hypothetical protein